MRKQLNSEVSKIKPCVDKNIIKKEIKEMLKTNYGLTYHTLKIIYSYIKNLFQKYGYEKTINEQCLRIVVLFY